jgi:endonuclease YncB( thermonuclease family)
MRYTHVKASMAVGLLLALANGAWMMPARAASGDIIEGVAAVIDAGTVKIGKTTIRLHGIIAPTARQKCKAGSLPWLCGAAARKHLVDLAQGETVRCLKIGAYHGRCFSAGVDLSENLVRNGWAVPDRAGIIHRDDENKARREKLGMWRYTD